MFFMHDGNGVRDFLMHNPFIYLSKNKELKGAVWISKDEDVNEEYFSKSFKRMERAGVEQCDTYDMDNFMSLLNKHDQ